MDSVKCLKRWCKCQERKKGNCPMSVGHRDGIVPKTPIISKWEGLSVSINFAAIMPSLKVISFGTLHEFQTLYFSELPVLTIFSTSSNWVQSYPACFPPQTGRKIIRGGQAYTSNVQLLQFPDSFQDCFLFTKIVPHFPHVAKISLNTPTVKFLRSFAKTMATTGPDSFHCLHILTQFDFASSLESCILAKIAKPSAVEINQLKALKAYPHWEEYVKENQIELPEEEPQEEDPDKFCGLGVLFSKLKFFTIGHIPRTLRLPKGLRHWIDDPRPEFTNTVIGFVQYPFSKAVEAAFPPRMILKTWMLDVSRYSNMTILSRNARDWIS